MRFVCNFSSCRVQPVEWALSRQEEGWDGVVVADHLFDAWGSRPHVWSVLGALAAGTTGLILGTGFANNLMRHPVEFAQASLTLQRLTDGRFEAGLGAGWTQDEFERTGRTLPSAKERADRLIEAVKITRQLFDSGASQQSEGYYRVDVERLEQLGEIPPPCLVVGAGGRRLIRSVTPYVDKLEIMPAAVATRTGSMNMEISNRISDDDVRSSIDLARAVREDVILRLYVPCCAGDDERARRIASSYDGFFARFQGEPGRVANAIADLGELGIDECHLAASDEASYTNLAPLLVGK